MRLPRSGCTVDLRQLGYLCSLAKGGYLQFSPKSISCNFTSCRCFYLHLKPISSPSNYLSLKKKEATLTLLIYSPSVTPVLKNISISTVVFSMTVIKRQCYLEGGKKIRHKLFPQSDALIHGHFSHMPVKNSKFATESIDTEQTFITIP